MTLAELLLRLLTRTLPPSSCSASPVRIISVRISAAALLLSAASFAYDSSDSSSAIRWLWS